jgi:hypothetical protein
MLGTRTLLAGIIRSSTRGVVGAGIVCKIEEPFLDLFVKVSQATTCVLI